MPARRPLPVLAEHRQVDVVLDEHGASAARPPGCRAIGTSDQPFRFGARITMPRARIDDAGNAGADREQPAGRNLGVLHQRRQLPRDRASSSAAGSQSSGRRDDAVARAARRAGRQPPRRVRVGPRSMPATNPWRALNSMCDGRRPPREGPAPRSRGGRRGSGRTTRLPTVGAERPVASMSSARVNAPCRAHGRGQHPFEVQTPQMSRVRHTGAEFTPIRKHLIRGLPESAR